MSMPARKPDPDDFFVRLTLEERAQLQRRGRQRRWPRAASVFTEGERAEWVGVVLSGEAKVSYFTEEGKEVLLAIRGPGALIGELAAIDGEPRSATVSSLEPLEALVLPAAQFREFLYANPRVALLVLEMLSRKLRDADRKRIEFGAYDTLERVVRRLVELAERFGERTEEGVRITLPLSQEGLAGWTGSSREAVSKALQTLRGRGWVKTQRCSITVRNLEALRKRALLWDAPLPQLSEMWPMVGGRVST